MNVLLACEYSGIVRDAFIKAGHNAWSCDLLEGEGRHKEKHYKTDIFDVLWNDNFSPWDLMIAFPPCTDLAVSGARWFKEKRKDGRQQASIDFFMNLMNAPIGKIGTENPVGIMSTIYRKPDQIIQPYHFGDPERKTTCLWLKNLPRLKPTNIVEPEFILGKNGKKYTRTHWLGGGTGHERSRFFPGIAKAMAEQWG